MHAGPKNIGSWPRPFLALSLEHRVAECLTHDLHLTSLLRPFRLFAFDTGGLSGTCFALRHFWADAFWVGRGERRCWFLAWTIVVGALDRRIRERRYSGCALARGQKAWVWSAKCHSSWGWRASDVCFLWRPDPYRCWDDKWKLLACCAPE